MVSPLDKGAHSVFIGGQTAHRLMEGDEGIVDHLVKLVGKKAAQIQAQTISEAAE